MSRPYSVERANERDDRIRREVAKMDEQTLRSLRAGALSWQIAVNGLLIDAGYHSDEMGLLGKADLMRMDEAFALGQSPEEFAAGVLERAEDARREENGPSDSHLLESSGGGGSFNHREPWRTGG